MKFIKKIVIVLFFLNYTLYGSAYNNTFSSFYKNNSSCFKAAGISALGLLCCGAYYLTENNPWQSELFQGSLFASAVGSIMSGGHLIRSHINRNEKLLSLCTVSKPFEDMGESEDIKEDDFSRDWPSSNSFINDISNVGGVTGFKNDSNRCYMNSTLQLLRIIFRSQINLLTIDGTDKLFNCVATRIQEMEGGRLNEQRDARHCLSELLDYMRSYLPENKESDNSQEKIDDTNSIQIVSYKPNGRDLASPVDWIDVSIVTEKENRKLVEIKNLHESLENYITHFNPESNAGSIKLPFYQIGKSLIIKLNRFMQHNSDVQKLMHKVDVPLELDMTSYLANKSNRRIYELKGVVVHIGSSIDFGHYIAYIKADNAWLCCNDAIVTKVDEANVVEAINSNAYIILYGEKNSTSANLQFNNAAPTLKKASTPLCCKDHYNFDKTTSNYKIYPKQCSSPDYYLLSVENDKFVIKEFLPMSITADTNNDEPTQEIDHIPCFSILKFYGSKEKLESILGFKNFREKCYQNSTSILLYPREI